MGAVFGSIPFMLKERVSYDALAAFSFAGWPYSIKLFIAPIVDSVYSARIGRRKSWITVAQTVSGSLMFFLGPSIAAWVDAGRVAVLTPVFFAIMSVTACQDIAVDSWALTLLRPENMAYASTCQSVGLSIGYFATFTIFLALQDASFCNNYFRPYISLPFAASTSGPVTDLSSMLRSVGFIYLVTTALVFFFKHEAGTPGYPSVAHQSPGSSAKANSSLSPTRKSRSSDSYTEKLLPLGSSGILDSSASSAGSKSSSTSMAKPGAIADTYVKLFRVTKLPAIRQLILVLLISKAGFSAFDNISALKLLDAGFPKQSMAVMAVFQAPASIVTSVIAGSLASKYGPVLPYVCGFALRVVMSTTGPMLVAYFRMLGGVSTPLFYVSLLTSTIVYSIGSDLMFVSISAFFLNIGEDNEDIGGSFLTLLATFSNLGGMWPKSVALFFVERLNSSWSDGFYVLSAILLPISIVTGVFVHASLTQLLRLPKSAWRASRSNLAP